MFNQDITLNPTTYGGSNTNKVYSLLGNASLSESVRRVSATASTTPETLSIKHREVKVRDCKTDQHLVRLDEQQTDPLKGECQLSCRVVLEVPKGTTVITAQAIKDIVGRAVHALLTAGHLDKLLNSET